MFDLAIAVVQRDGIESQIATVDGDAPCRVIQIVGLDNGAACARLQNRSLGVVQVRHVQVELACMQCPFRIMQGGVGRNIQRTWRRDDSLAGVDIALCRRQPDVGGASLATADIELGAGQIGIACRQNLAMRGEVLRSADRQVTRRAQLAIGLDTGADQAARAAVDGLCRKVVVTLCRDHTCIGDGTTGIQYLIARRIQAARVIQGVERGVQV
ncbi:hypothetical protein D3C81_939860 [compost metagenome]